MADGLVNMSSQFSGLPMSDLIGGPLRAACDSQIMLAKATADFIDRVGFILDNNNKKVPNVANFSFYRPVAPEVTEGSEDAFKQEFVTLEVPMLAIVKVPNLSVTTVDITFDMEVKSSSSHKDSKDLETAVDAKGSVGWGPFKASVKIHGSVASHKENTRSSDNSAKYHVQVHAEDKGMPEGLARVMDILMTSIAPKQIGGAPT